ncbi:MAG: tRNA pseudouridine(55) synthase TruB [Fidelibacterota bacterium]
MPIYKPRGWTSFDVVKKIRRITGERKVGHAGTLDPFAEGVLVVAIGRQWTRQLSRLTGEEKEYDAVLKLGIQTDTLDPEGKVVATSPVLPLSEARIEEAFLAFTGRIQQTPPMYSSKKVDGVRLYKLARKNIEIEREPVTVEIKNLRLNSLTKDTLDFSVTCSKGTYVRQLGADIARSLGTVGHLIFLKRIRVGNYSIEDCKSLQDLEEEWLSIAA